MVEVEHERLSSGTRVLKIAFDFQTGTRLPAPLIRRASATRSTAPAATLRYSR
jgi:hypothetical protein